MGKGLINSSNDLAPFVWNLMATAYLATIKDYTAYKSRTKYKYGLAITGNDGSMMIDSSQPSTFLTKEKDPWTLEEVESCSDDLATALLCKEFETTAVKFANRVVFGDEGWSSFGKRPEYSPEALQTSPQQGLLPLISSLIKETNINIQVTTPGLYVEQENQTFPVDGSVIINSDDVSIS